jgi:hypothetical protein
MAYEPSAEQLAYLKGLDPAIREARIALERWKRAVGDDPTFAAQIADKEAELEAAERLRAGVLEEYLPKTRRGRST